MTMTPLDEVIIMGIRFFFLSLKVIVIFEEGQKDLQSQ